MFENYTHVRPAALLGAGAAALVGLQVLTAAPALAQGSQQWTTPGRYTFMVPKGVTAVTASITGAGGGGGGHFDSTTPQGFQYDEQTGEWKSVPGEPVTVPGAGGGGGATESCTMQVPPGSNVIIEVGEPGVGGKAGEPGTDGERSYAGISNDPERIHTSDGLSGAGGTGGGNDRGGFPFAYGDPLGAGGQGGNYVVYGKNQTCSMAEGQGGGSTIASVTTPGDGGAAARPATGCPVDAGQGGPGAALNEDAGQTGKPGCVVITY